jgi:cellulose synthase/poly-beta-1,6-N-acetylglucosamine synthase-like glycosyltransferase
MPPLVAIPSIAPAAADDVVAVIPAYNEARTLRPLIEALLPMLPHIVVVDDGSSDDTLPSLAGLPVQVCRHAVNRGKAAALRSGFEHALALGYRGIVTVDADGQHAPEDVHALLRLARRRGEDLVVAARQPTPQQPRLRRWANRFADFWVSWAAGRPVADSQSGLRYYPRAAAQRLLAMPDGGFALESAVLIESALAGIALWSVAIPARYGPNLRRSHFRPVRDIAAIVRTVSRYLLWRGGRWARLRGALARRGPAGVARAVGM